MRSAIDLQHKIATFYKKLSVDPHHRYRSWEHCYEFFRSRTSAALITEKNVAALHLGFYLASWGMYRGSSFLLQRSYTVHLGVVETLASEKFTGLWKTEMGSGAAAKHQVELLLQLVAAVKDAYRPFGLASDILATKVVLGTIGCLPAVDRFFIAGFRRSGRQYSRLNRAFVERIIEFCVEHGSELRMVQKQIETEGGQYYPLMKLADMYFWQIGYDTAPLKARKEADFLE